MLFKTFTIATLKLISWFWAFSIDMLLKDIGEEKEDEGKEESKEEKDVDTQVSSVVHKVPFFPLFI